MNREALIQKAVMAMEKLPIEKTQEISDFIDFILSKYEEQSIVNGIAKIAEQSDAFGFLAEEESLYSVADIKNKE